MRKEGGMNRFINSSEHQLIGSLGAYLELFDQTNESADNRQRLCRFRSRLREFDAECLVQPESFWGTLIEQMEYELDS
jgi:hypothetical protein